MMRNFFFISTNGTISLTKGINTNIENIELTMPPEYLPSVQGDSVSIFNSINERGRKVDEKILKEIKNSEKKRKP